MVAKLTRRTLIAGLLLAPATESVLAGAKTHYRTAILSGELAGGVWLAGLDIQMDDGWKTYWRVPGDAGIPPTFDWSRSENVKHVELRWPAPRRYNDAAGETIGYLTRVVFPLRVTPIDPALPVTLNLDAFFAVCKDVCVPATAKLSTPFVSDPGAASLIAAFDARVPVAGDIVRTAELGEDAGQPGLVLALEGNLGEDADIFVEGFDAAYFRRPRKLGENYILPIDGLKSREQVKGKLLKLTVVDGQRQLEQSIAVD